LPKPHHLAIRLIAFALLVLSHPGFAHAAARNPEDYPLRVHIFDKHQHRVKQFRHYFSYIGNGRGNIVEGDQINGMEYTFDCANSFLDSEADEDYPAKWKKPGLSLELLMGIIGSETGTRTCELKVELRDYVFAKSNGKVIQISQQEYFARQAARMDRDRALAPQDTDPAHYPLELSILNLNWTGNTSGMHSGAGQGNLKTPSGLAAVDFVIRCPVVIQAPPEGRYYRGRWIEPWHTMTLLLGNLEDPRAGATCELTSNLNPDVYVRQSSGIIKAVSQEEYKKMQSP